MVKAIFEGIGGTGYFLLSFDGAVRLKQEQLLKPMRPRILPERLVFMLPIMWILFGLFAQDATTQPTPALGSFLRFRRQAWMTPI